MKIFHVLNVLGVLLALHLPVSAMEADNKDSYTVTGHVVASATGQGMAGVRITSPDIQVAAMYSGLKAAGCLPQAVSFCIICCS